MYESYNFIKQKRADKPLKLPAPLVSFSSEQFLWVHSPIVNADIIYQAREERSGFHSFTSAYVKAANRTALRARNYHSQTREIRLRILTHNLAILWRQILCSIQSRTLLIFQGVFYKIISVV